MSLIRVATGAQLVRTGGYFAGPIQNEATFLRAEALERLAVLVHEPTRLGWYVDRFGDPDGIADRIQQNLLDLHSVTRRAVVLPVPSYSLKVIEEYVGYRRSQDEYGGDWSMAKYIEAVETEDVELRQEVMEAILAYNREDLEATWAVLLWLRERARSSAVRRHVTVVSGSDLAW